MYALLAARWRGNPLSGNWLPGRPLLERPSTPCLDPPRPALAQRGRLGGSGSTGWT
jgi:hypothetical protein